METNQFGLSSSSLKKYLLPFILVTGCFVLWGFANNVTNPMVSAFSKIFRMSVTEAALVPVAFNLGYFCMAFPAAMYIQRYSFKHGIMVGLVLYAIGALLFIPAKELGFFTPFLLAYFILTCGLSFLETSCNPYIFSLGSEDSGILRLNIAQAFNPVGSLAGMYVAMTVHSHLSPMSSQDRMHLPEAQFNIIKDHDLGVLIQPYIFIALVVVAMLVFIFFTKMKNEADTGTTKSPLTALRELLEMKNFREGVVAEFFYVGAQVSCWTFIIQYGTRVFMAEGIDEQAAQVLSQKYNLVAMLMFAAGRFICTFLMRYFTPTRMLTVLAVIGGVAVGGAILFTDRNGLYCLIAVSACMSLMFPTIYGISLLHVGENVKYAGAGLIMAILGGSILPPLQAAVIDSHVSFLGLPSTNVSFILPLVCFIIIALYGHRAYVRHHITHRY